MRRRVAVKLAAIWLTVAVPLTLVLAFTYYQWYQARVSLVQQQRLGYAELTRTSFQLLVADMQHTMGPLGELVAAGNPASPESTAVLHRAVQPYPADSLVLTDPAGRVIGASVPGLIGQDLAADPALRTALDSSNGTGIEPSMVTTGGAVGFHVAQRFRMPDGGPGGVMLMFVNVRKLGQQFPVTVPAGGISVIDSTGQVVFQNEHPEFAEQRVKWGAFPFVHSALDGHVALTQDWRFPGDGVRYGAFVPLRQLGWAAGSSVNRAEALAPFFRALAIAFPVTVLLGIVSLLAAITISRNIRESLVTLAEDAERIGSGELAQPVHTGRADEIGDVARSLDVARLHLDEARREAGQELETSRLLLQASTTLARYAELQQVLQALAEVLLRTLGHRRVLVFLWDETARAIVVSASAGESGYPSGAALRYDELSAPVRRALDERRTIVMDFDELPREEAPRAAELGLHLVLAVPIVRGSSLIGLVAVDDLEDRRPFSEREVDLTEGIAAQASVAIENARLYEEERTRRERIEALQEVSSLATSSLDPQEIADRVLGFVAGRLEVDVITKWAFNEERSRLFPAAGVGFSTKFFERFSAGIGVDEPFEVARAYREGRPVVHETAEDIPAAVLESYETYAKGLGALLVLPLHGRKSTFGAITFAWNEPRRIDEDDVAFFTSVARILSISSENAELYEREARSRKFGELLNELNAEIAGTLEFEEILQRTVVRAGEALHSEGAAIEVRSGADWPVRYVWNLPSARVGRPLTRQTIISETVAQTHELLVVEDSEAAESRVAQALRENGIRALLAVPLIVRGETAGVIIFPEYSGPRRYNALETDFARKLGSAVSLALETARLYEVEHRVAQTLQQALLELPSQIEGVSFAHDYRSATEMARVGGDFYDLFELEHGNLGIVIGDISGKGINAAVLTSLVKNTIRARSTEEGTTPADALRVANDVLLRWSPTEVFATVFYGVLDCRDGRFVYCSGGHTTGAVLCAAGGVRTLETNSPLVGAFADVSYVDSESILAKGDMLFLYTDGLTEAHGDGRLYGEERVFATLRRLAHKDPETVVQGMVDSAVAFSGGGLSDDLAILALQRTEELHD